MTHTPFASTKTFEIHKSHSLGYYHDYTLCDTTGNLLCQVVEDPQTRWWGFLSYFILGSLFDRFDLTLFSADQVPLLYMKKDRYSPTHPVAILDPNGRLLAKARWPKWCKRTLILEDAQGQQIGQSQLVSFLDYDFSLHGADGKPLAKYNLGNGVFKAQLISDDPELRLLLACVPVLVFYLWYPRNTPFNRHS